MANQDSISHGNDDEGRIFHHGLQLFNTGQWFDAHETWEDIWHIATGDKKRFYQGLIQYAVVLEHIRRGNPRGARSVYTTCKQKFDGLPQEYMGIEIADILEGLESMMQPVLAMGPQAFSPSAGRGQDMPVDLANAPKIQLKYDPFA